MPRQTRVKSRMQLIRNLSERIALAALRLAFPEWFCSLQAPVAGFLLVPLELQSQGGVEVPLAGCSSPTRQLVNPLLLGEMRRAFERPTKSFSMVRFRRPVRS